MRPTRFPEAVDTCPSSGSSSPVRIRNSVVLPRYVFSQQADPLPGVHLKGQFVQDPVAHLKLFTDV